MHWNRIYQDCLPPVSLWSVDFIISFLPITVASPSTTNNVCSKTDWPPQAVPVTHGSLYGPLVWGIKAHIQSPLDRSRGPPNLPGAKGTHCLAFGIFLFFCFTRSVTGTMTPSLAPCLDITLSFIHRKQPVLLLPHLLSSFPGVLAGFCIIPRWTHHSSLPVSLPSPVTSHSQSQSIFPRIMQSHCHFSNLSCCFGAPGSQQYCLLSLDRLPISLQPPSAPPPLPHLSSSCSVCTSSVKLFFPHLHQPPSTHLGGIYSALAQPPIAPRVPCETAPVIFVHLTFAISKV